ncbi:MAG: hypothetical protein IKK91_09840 [Ruminococcus sp.]|nr:hypothetical protein [Ruminococcus sp.]
MQENCLIIDIAKKFIDYISNNSTWIKDISWVIFTFVATVIAILTYANAKKSVFQPLNSEVIKHQTKMFVDLYELIKGNLFEKIDYETIFFVTFYGCMQELGFKFNCSPEISEELERINKLPHVFVVGQPPSGFQELDNFIPNQIYNVCDFPIESGKPLALVTIAETVKNMNFLEELQSIINDPFLPEKAKKILLELYEDIIENQTGNIYNYLSELINNVWLNDNINVEKEAINAYNCFVENAKDHIAEQEKIFKIISEYLRVNKLFK